nr:cation transporter [Neoroseomonas eburnea]
MLNLGYLGVEFAVALSIGSVSLLADSVDFLEDAAVNFLIFAALGWSANPHAHRQRAARRFNSARHHARSGPPAPLRA